MSSMAKPSICSVSIASQSRVAGGRYPCRASRRLSVCSVSASPRPSNSSGSQPREERYELRVCTNRTCKRQGSKQILQFATDLCLDNVDVKECGCLGKCGNGPNIAVAKAEAESSDGRSGFYSYASTPARLCKILALETGAQVDEVVVQATELRRMGKLEAQSGDLEAAIRYWDQGIELQPSAGLYALYSNRSAAKQTLGDNEGALDDAVMALELAPPNFITAHVRKIDALYALNKIPEAIDALHDCLGAHPDYADTAEYKNIQRALDNARK